MVRQRILSAVVFLPPILAATWFGDHSCLWASIWFSLGVGVAALLGAAEFYHLGRQGGWQPLTALGLLGTALFIANAHFDNRYTGHVLAGMLVLCSLGLLLRNRVEDAFVNLAWTVGGMIYVGWLLGYLMLLMKPPYGHGWVLLALLSVFAADTSAYFVGRRFGRHRLAPRISPNKTWEGTVGAVVGAVAASVGLAAIFGLAPRLGYGQAAALGVIIAAFALFGDLTESLLKRSTGAKDAGTIIPGHGGVLDRLDSILFTVVAVYYFVHYLAAA